MAHDANPVSSAVICSLEAKTNVPTLLRMDSAAAQRRLKAINRHLATGVDSESPLRPNPTAGEFFSGAPSLCAYYFSSSILVLNFDRVGAINAPRFCGVLILGDFWTSKSSIQITYFGHWESEKSFHTSGFRLFDHTFRLQLRIIQFWIVFSVKGDSLYHFSSSNSLI